MKTLPDLSIITINYGGSAEVKNLWESIQKYTGNINYEFIVVDNASPKNDVENLKTLFKDTEVHVIALDTNLGFGGGYGEGIKFAQGEFMAIINPDITLTENCLEPLIEALKTETRASLVAPRLLNPDGTAQQNARHFPTPWVMFGRRLATKFNWSYDSEEKWYESQSPQPVDWVQGSFMCLKKDTFVNLLQGFDPRFFLFLEDTDLCRRLWKLNLRVLLIPAATAVHSEHRLSGGNLWHAWRKKTFWIHLSSALKYFWKYKGEKLPDIK
ncbi:glycosyltransferase family 2 protein [bacterium]|nr:glycosyltransferase family 2 protein [bacterium]NCQ55240.1 glycosyltransferase family 2 protein [Candidatus Parcubacteria bacterium]NCS67247.1 glycosyltransferase family 2 protein [Candidatus Peregrinibacteria bacterium]NCS96502.1 glycosyltransferase family 2 protein [bacterium]